MKLFIILIFCLIANAFPNSRRLNNDEIELDAVTCSFKKIVPSRLHGICARIFTELHCLPVDDTRGIDVQGTCAQVNTPCSYDFVFEFDGKCTAGKCIHHLEIGDSPVCVDE